MDRAFQSIPCVNPRRPVCIALDRRRVTLRLDPGPANKFGRGAFRTLARTRFLCTPESEISTGDNYFRNQGGGNAREAGATGRGASRLFAQLEIRVRWRLQLPAQSRR